MSEYIRLQANGADAYPDASTENTYRPNGTSVESALVNLESNVTTLGGVAGEAKTLAEQNSVKIATAEQEISDINSSLYKNEAIIGLQTQYASGFYYTQCFTENNKVYIKGELRGTFPSENDYAPLSTPYKPINTKSKPDNTYETTIRFGIITDTGVGYGYVSENGVIHIIPNTECTKVWIDTMFEYTL